MAKPTYRDAALMLQLAQNSAALGLPKAASWLWSDEFIPDYAEFVKKYPRGSEGSVNAANMCGFYETVGTLYKHGLLNEDLLFDWLAISAVWDRLKGFALGVRQEAGNLRLYENFEAMANADAAWAAKRAKLAAKAKGRKR